MGNLGGYSDSEDDDEQVVTTVITLTDHQENVPDVTKQSGRLDVITKIRSPHAHGVPDQTFDTGLSAVAEEATQVPDPVTKMHHETDRTPKAGILAINVSSASPLVLPTTFESHGPAAGDIPESDDQDEMQDNFTSQFGEDIFMDDSPVDLDLPGSSSIYRKARANFDAGRTTQSRKSPRRDDDDDRAKRKKEPRRMESPKHGHAPDDPELDDFDTDDEDAVGKSPVPRPAHNTLFGGPKNHANSLFGNLLFGSPRQVPPVEDSTPKSHSGSLRCTSASPRGTKADSFPLSDATSTAVDSAAIQSGSDTKVTEFTFGLDDQEPGTSPRNVLNHDFSDMHLNGAGNMCNDMPPDDRESDFDSSTLHGGCLSSSPSPSRSSSSLQAKGNPRQFKQYALRTNIDREIKGGYIDSDKTGTFDPEEEARKRAVEKQKAKERKKRASAPRSRAPKLDKLIMRFKFPRLGYGHVRNQVFDEEYDEHGKLLPTDTASYFDNNYEALDEEEKQEQLERQERWKLIKLREKIRRKNMRQRTADVEILPHEPIIDTLKKETKKATKQEDLTNHPEVCGCKGCREKNKVCSMRLGGGWPCELCNDEDACELFVLPPPSKESKCNHCKVDCDEDEDNYCSFVMENQAPHYPCKQCKKAGHPNCISGIPKGYKHPRVDLDAIAYGPKRKYVDCAICRADGKRCSLKSRDKRGPCSRCKKNGWGCAFGEKPFPEDLRRMKHDEKGGFDMDAKDNDSDDESDEAPTPVPAQPHAAEMWDPVAYLNVESTENLTAKAPKIEPDDEMYFTTKNGHNGRVVELSTSFFHPITFKTASDGPEEDGCDFCFDPMHGFIGLCERKLSAIEWDTGLGYTELVVRSGVAGDPKLSGSVMCQNCVLNRLQVLCCPSHELVEFNVEKTDFDEVAGEMLELAVTAGPEDNRIYQQHFCSLCFSLAKHRCCTVAPNVGATGEGESDMVDGCGLTLCELCSVRLKNEFNMNLSEENGLAEALDKAPKFKKCKNAEMYGCVRADVGFFAQSGLLNKNANAIKDSDGGDNQVGDDAYMDDEDHITENREVQQAWASSGFGTEWQSMGGYGHGFMNRDDPMDMEWHPSI